jgi:integrase
MASAFITKRETSSGEARFVVRYRLGGRAYPIRHAGSFKRQRDAEARRRFVDGELAAGRNPAIALSEFRTPRQVQSLADSFERFIESRIDVGDKTRELYRNARDRIIQHVGDRDPQTITPADIQQVVAANADLGPRSLRKYKSTWAQVFDFVDVNPNPCRSKKLKLPMNTTKEINPPSEADWARIKANVSKKTSLIIRLIECAGLRVSEAVGLTYGNVDFANQRIRVSRSTTKTPAGVRWLSLPQELLDEIDVLVPLEDRHPDRLVFSKMTIPTVRDALYRACRNAAIASYSPHDLRHRRVSLWVAQNFDPVAVKTWAGHSRTSMTLDVYSHVLLDANADQWKAHWGAVYAAERAPRVAPVWSGGVR